MSSSWNQRRAVFAALLLASLLPFRAGAEIDPVSRSWEEPSLVRFQYRLFPEAPLGKILVSQNGKAIPFRQSPFANNPLNTSAILVLVDTSAGTSKLPRDKTLSDNKQWIGALLSQAQSRNLIGVYTFANDLVEIAPVGVSFAEIRHRIDPLKANGLGTRIYRRGMDAIEILAKTNATRRALVIVSDGKDEDTGFTKDDLVQAAKKQNIVVFALGCPETATEIPALGNLEKIAAETHGLYAQAAIGTAGSRDRAKADAAFAQTVLNSIDSGGEVLIPTESIDASAPIDIELITEAGEKFSYTHQRTAPQDSPAPSGPNATPVAAAPRAAQPFAARKPEPSWIGKNGIYLAEGGAILVLAAAGIWLRKKRLVPPPAVETAEELEPPQPVAYLEMQDADSSRVPIFLKASRIGRNPGNDIVFSNTSVSGFHAEIHAKRDGSFYISDLGSGNGVLVNDRRIAQSADLKEGDLIELGEVRFRFRLG